MFIPTIFHIFREDVDSLFPMTDLISSLSPHPLFAMKTKQTNKQTLNLPVDGFSVSSGLNHFLWIPESLEGRYSRNLKILSLSQKFFPSISFQVGKWGNLGIYLLWERRCLFTPYILGPYTLQLRYWILLISGQEPLVSLGPLTMSLVLSNLWADKKVLQIHQRPRLLQVFTSAVLRDNPRYLYVCIPVSRKEQGGREVQLLHLKMAPGSFTYYFRLYSIGQNFVTWLNLVHVRLVRANGYSGWP